jgi:hypothetical protein
VAGAIGGAAVHYFEILDSIHLFLVEETQGFAAVLETFLQEQV